MPPERSRVSRSLADTSISAPRPRTARLPSSPPTASRPQRPGRGAQRRIASVRTGHTGSFGPLSEQEIYRLREERVQARAAYIAACRTPPPKPTDWPRSDWSLTAFAPPYYPGDPPVDSDQIAWACEKATVALVRHGVTDATTVYLAILDKILQLNAYSRNTRCANGYLPRFCDWQLERENDIEEFYERALAEFTISDTSLTDCKSICMAALKLDYWYPFDAQEVYDKRGQTFARGWLGPYAPVPADAAAHGMAILTGTVSLKADPNKLLKAALDWEAAHPGVPLFDRPSPLHSMPPLNPDPLPRDPPAGMRYLFPPS